jgi:hypothetical protein
MKINMRHMVSALLMVWYSALALAEQPAHLKLLDPLDRPQDGYCIDVVGTPGNLRTDLPLFAHNCKRSLTIDSAVIHDRNGAIRFPELNQCVTVAGINSVALPGTAVILHPCGENSAFFQSTALQRFTLQSDGKLRLNQSDLCLAVGAQSATTYSAADKWRPLFVDQCDNAVLALSRWTFAAP